jgi:hypothetical protein
VIGASDTAAPTTCGGCGRRLMQGYGDDRKPYCITSGCSECQECQLEHALAAIAVKDKALQLALADQAPRRGPAMVGPDEADHDQWTCGCGAWALEEAALEHQRGCLWVALAAALAHSGRPPGAS